MSGDVYQNGLTSLSHFVTIFLISALRSLRSFSIVILHKLSNQSAAICVLCCVMVVSVEVEAKKRTMKM